MRVNPLGVALVMGILFIVSVLFAGQGVSMQNKVAGEEAKLHALQEEYFSLDKATRDGAAANSVLNEKLVEIQQFPSMLLELKLVGIGKILTGIFILLAGIMLALVMMPLRLADVLEQVNKKK